MGAVPGDGDVLLGGGVDNGANVLTHVAHELVQKRGVELVEQRADADNEWGAIQRLIALLCYERACTHGVRSEKEGEGERET